MIITISGLPGSGKTSVGKFIAKKLNFKFYSMGDIIQSFVLSKKMTLLQFNQLRNKEQGWDIMVDSYQKELVKKEKNVILDGITSFHLFPKSVKVFLAVKPEVGAMRIFKAKRPDEPYNSYSEALRNVKKRIKDDRARYKKLYNVDCHNVNNFDIAIDTSSMKLDEIVECILEVIKKRR